MQTSHYDSYCQNPQQAEKIIALRSRGGMSPLGLYELQAVTVA